MREGAVSPLLDDCTCTSITAVYSTYYYCYYMPTTVTTAIYLHTLILILCNYNYICMHVYDRTVRRYRRAPRQLHAQH